MFKRVLRPRVLAYTAVLLLIVSAFAYSVATRSPFRADVVRDRGALARLVDNGAVENVYRIQLMNATESAQRFRIDADGLPNASVMANRGDKNSDSTIEVGPTQARWVPVAVQISAPAAVSLGAGAHAMQFRIRLLRDAAPGSSSSAESAHEISEKSTFVVPR